MSAAEKLAGAAPGHAPDWNSIPWSNVRRHVCRLQARIVKATQEGRWNKAKALVYLLTHSFSGRALAIARVTENSGAKTPGVDGETWPTSEAKSAAFNTLRRHGYQPQPLRRVYIPKSNGKQRPLGIPTLRDRAMQALYLLGLDPIAETQADHHSYGFRLERCCQDALKHCQLALRRRSDRCTSWVLEGDIKACFDGISHEWLLEHIPMDTELLRQWLKAGYLEKHVLFATTEGTPQGGIISPVLANWALDGLQGILAQHFDQPQSRLRATKVHLVRYADDFIITGTSKVLLQAEVQPLVAHFLSKRGLELSHEKTRITHITDGFNFLGQNVRRLSNGRVLLKPSKPSVKTFLSKLRKTIDQAGQKTAGELIQRLNQQIKGWAMYHRNASSSRTFAYVDDRIYHMLRAWCRKRHPNKGWKWIKQKYFQTQGHRHWIFHGTVRLQDKDCPIQLMKAQAVPIRDHVLIRTAVNPYDPQWEGYLENRQRWRLEQTSAGRAILLSLWRTQHGICGHCTDALLPDRSTWCVHYRTPRCQGGLKASPNMELVHWHCHQQIHTGQSTEGIAASREGR
jgi:RNA-directed DNA polymerase